MSETDLSEFCTQFAQALVRRWQLRALFAALLFLVCGVAFAAITVTPAPTAQCNSVPVTTSTDLAKLQADADCFGNAAGENQAAADAYTKAAQAALAEQKARLDRIAWVKANPPAPTVSQSTIDACNKASGTVWDGAKCVPARWCAGGIKIPASLDWTQCKTWKPSSPAPAPTPTPAPPPVITCPQGQHLMNGVCMDDAPPPTGDEPSPSLDGAAPIASTYDVNTYLSKSWGTGAIPPSAKPDVVGAFRFILEARGLSNDDPIVYPGQPGKSHLHQFYGQKCDAYDTYASLRAKALTAQNPNNGACYWMPAMLDGNGNVVAPDTARIYYKRRPKSDPVVSALPGTPVTPLTTNDQRYAQGIAVDLPNGLKFVFGYDMVTGKAPTGALYFNCDGPGATQGHYASIPAAMKFCPAGSTIGAIISAPDCWDGKRLDSANHRDHMAYGYYHPSGGFRCPTTHPYVIPDFTLQAWYSIKAGDDLSKWQFSSDAMQPSLPHGSTFHADFFMAWDPTVKKMWHDNCINKMLNCSGGDMGNGLQLKSYSQPSYGNFNPNRLISLSSLPYGGMAH